MMNSTPFDDTVAFSHISSRKTNHQQDSTTEQQRPPVIFNIVPKFEIINNSLARMRNYQLAQLVFELLKSDSQEPL